MTYIVSGAALNSTHSLTRICSPSPFVRVRLYATRWTESLQLKLKFYKYLSHCYISAVFQP